MGCLRSSQRSCRKTCLSRQVSQQCRLKAPRDLGRNGRHNAQYVRCIILQVLQVGRRPPNVGEMLRLQFLSKGNGRHNAPYLRCIIQTSKKSKCTSASTAIGADCPCAPSYCFSIALSVFVEAAVCWDLLFTEVKA